MPVEAALRYWTTRGNSDRSPTAVCPRCTSPRYEAWSRAKLQAWTLARLARLAPGGRFRRVVDLGCGTGDWAELLAPIADEIVVVDVSPGFVDQAAERLRRLSHPRWRAECCDVRRFDDIEGADLVFLGCVLTYLDEPDVLEMLRKVRSRMAPDGLVYQRDYCAARPHSKELRTDTADYFSVQRWALRYLALAEACGLRVIECRPSWWVYGDQWATERLACCGPAAVRAGSAAARAVFGAAALASRACSYTFLYSAR
ncbi:MAG: class I SAM-dependent methyltransferase [Deltaproteobacteria bacterium]|nr:class I SAM-dependent methyltransferase [Deltaproteobacteria bacterium]